MMSAQEPASSPQLCRLKFESVAPKSPAKSLSRMNEYLLYLN